MCFDGILHCRCVLPFRIIKRSLKGSLCNRRPRVQISSLNICKLQSRCLSPPKRNQVTMDCVTVTFSPCLAEHNTAARVLLSFSPVEVDLAKADRQVVDVLLCVYCLVFLVHVACWLKLPRKYPRVSVCSSRGMCLAPKPEHA